MIAGCIERMGRDACVGCERRDACSRLAEMFGFVGARREPRAPPPPRRGGDASSPFLAFLGKVARAIEAAGEPKESPFQRQVEARIEPLLPNGAANIDQVARAMGLSRQTLYRRLKAEGMTFERLLDRLRRKLAIRLIRDDGAAVKEAAWRLGFSDPAAFSRAFKRWTGRSPSEMRRDQPG